MDVEALIAAVYKRSPIWDKANKLHANREKTDTLWKEISDELNFEGKGNYTVFFFVTICLKT